MTKFGKKIRRAACVTLSALTLGTATLAFSSCASDFTKATLTIDFNDETYTIS
ncbi:MAG: hypothetical protein J6Z36_00635 [Clostridia bacterium]|nr:hypothetical protein [Clostridia bacterium]